ncbi:MAG: hypothetical protein ACHQT8_05740, partial [Chlamydiales bacterium]
MFHKMTVRSSLLFAATTLLGAAYTCIIHPSDIAAYKELVYSLQKKSPTHKQISSHSHQTRQGVRKDIWFAQEDGTRLQTRIESRSYLLTLQPKGNRFEAVEELQKIRCWMQDRLYLSSTSHP